MKAYVGVTDGKWYDFLAERVTRFGIREINFWRPSGKGAFRVLSPGDLFFFKTHFPHNKVVGGGVYSGFARLRVSEAWNLLGEGNGAPSIDLMRERISSYRKEPIGDGEDPVIGCILLRDPFFFPAGLAADPPPGFAPNLVQGKGYDLSLNPGHADYFDRLCKEAEGLVPKDGDSAPWKRPGPVYGAPRPVTPRLGQQAFKAVILNTYDGRCAVSGSRIRPTLQAAHIRPLPAGGEHRADNGILLRSDIHTLFDRGYLGLDEEHRLLVSHRLRKDFDGTACFYEKAGQQVLLPERRSDHPNREFTSWHRRNVFLTS
ncbi:HNH endonuclease [Marinactinospora thermotolerans]|uniref:Putative restriction endonuclease n=1 Tax=Marinactinospora thermotolerans DSM 45154 TaxID=1122192 RepID=A0A1T4TBT1_9ACTN|nr:HNH endonuclease [Marinactinospora thermotolerans]SKA37944.1 putative restriction endonuclease [Marinactinospora thermotolerans DSM 45154]